MVVVQRASLVAVVLSLVASSPTAAGPTSADAGISSKAGGSAADAKKPKKLEMLQAFRDCTLVEKVDAWHGGKLTDTDREKARACMSLGIAYEHGDQEDEDHRPIQVNYKLALRYYGEACKAEISFGCVSAGQLYEKGRAAPVKGLDTQASALVWYSMGCYQESNDEAAFSCLLAGQAMFKGSLAKTKKGKAQAKLAAAMKVFERACELGNDDGCKTVIQVREAVSK